MSKPNNYIVDQNRYKLAGPPDWWLQRLWDFDDSLVVIPSRQSFCYRLAQKRPLSLKEQMVHELSREQSDSQMMATYGLVPVTTIVANPNWDNPLMFQELAERAPWRQGGAEKVIQHIEAREAEKDAAIDRQNDEMTTGLSKDGWKLYRKKIGLGRSWHGAAAPTPKDA